MTRYEANMQIILRLQNYLEQHKDVRFHQALFNLSINEFSEGTINNMKKMSFNNSVTTFKDKYSEESEITLKNMKNE